MVCPVNPPIMDDGLENPVSLSPFMENLMMNGRHHNIMTIIPRRPQRLKLFKLRKNPHNRAKIHQFNACLQRLNKVIQLHEQQIDQLFPYD